MVNSDDMTVVLECNSLLTAKLAAEAGFAATYIGGSALSNFYYAMPDHGLITTTELVRYAAEIAPYIDIPLIVDGDQGGETAMTVRRFVRQLESVGVAGVHLEDTENPKHMYESDTLVPVDVMRARISTAVAARQDSDFVIIARTDELFNHGSVDEAIKRGIAYAEEGADAYFCLSMKPEDIEIIRQEVPIPLADINQPTAMASQSGLGIDIFTGQVLPYLARAYRQMAQQVREHGALDFHGWASEYEIIKPLLGDDEWMPVGRRWVDAARAGR